ncbi:MAG TPA: UDP-N-acetylmuramoyl-L-alanine--D-glutamate ligase [Nitrospiria bacterium]|nr:UDP-N-acetylmuramoyl-L-alanine--D-glutamate ligase [Candidatus Manganitrophaceae bacterium]HIL33809.1 UDP-N-acetylmuramoyl-L-alanine--D-glutamate ligase [Candidatus Manganitrophaceae bacterium]
MVKKRVTVVGMGKSGLAAALLLAAKGADVLVVDDIRQEIPPMFDQGSTSLSSVRFHLGNWRVEDLFRAELIVLSPGFPVSRLPMGRLQALKIPVIGELELAAGWLTAPMIAITGTNGKSTTTALIGEILKEWGWKVFLGGNFGTPLSEAVGSDWDFIVVEVSSFQLETVKSFHPRIAALLNITPDHLDRYPDMRSYQEAKWRIFENQSSGDHAVINLDDPLLSPPSLRGSTIHFSRNYRPRRGVYLQGEEIISNLWGEAETIIRLGNLQVKGPQYVDNVMAASAMTLLCGCSVEGIRQTLSHFKGLPHRMEMAGEISGVIYIDDSKGTNVGAMARSIESQISPIVLIAGGRDKEGDFTPLQGLVRKKVKRLILLGEAREKMARCFSHHPAVECVDSMKEAVERAAFCARPGDVVLLSPGCTSFDMFGDYAHRGDVFKKAVAELV